MSERTDIDIDLMSVDALLVGGIWYEVERETDASCPEAFVGEAAFVHSEFQGPDEKEVQLEQRFGGSHSWSMAISVHLRNNGGRVVFPLSAVQGIRGRP